jgi:hypothetical protein
MVGHSALSERPCSHERYRMTCADFDALWQHAEGRCEICRIGPEDTPDGKLFIDHARQYGFFAVRGLLCSKCNSLMRYVDRNEKQDHRATAYLANAWFVRVLHQRHAQNIAAARTARRPGAKQPARPEVPEDSA